MKAHRHSRGITLLGFLIMLCVAGFFAYVVMKLVPVYVEYFGVVKAMEQVKDEPGASQKSIEEIRRELNVKFDLQYVDDGYYDGGDFDDVAYVVVSTSAVAGAPASMPWALPRIPELVADGRIGHPHPLTPPSLLTRAPPPPFAPPV